MSHVVTVAIEIKDLDALRAVLEPLGLEFRQDQREFRWFGELVGNYKGQDALYHEGDDPSTFGKCDHAIALKGSAVAYEIGLIRQPSGSYRLAFDSWRGGYGLVAAAGAGCGRLLRSYGAEVTRRTLARSGYRLGSQSIAADGTVEMVFHHG